MYLYVGACKSDVLPSPKSQNHESDLFSGSIDLSVNCRPLPVWISLVLHSKDACGSKFRTVIVFVVRLFAPSLSESCCAETPAIRATESKTY